MGISHRDGRAARVTHRAVLAGVSLLALVALGACTTAEGTNALTDVGTFEREVMTSTLVGVGMIPKQDKDETHHRRAPLALPKKTAGLPAPAEDTASAQLPADSDTVQIDATGLSEEDLKRLRNARVVDPRSLSGRPLTEKETRALTARMTAAQVKSGPRPLYMPPEEYFTTVGGTDMVCLAENGDLVPLNDKACPPEIRDALRAQGPDSGGSIATGVFR